MTVKMFICLKNILENITNWKKSNQISAHTAVYTAKNIS